MALYAPFRPLHNINWDSAKSGFIFRKRSTEPMMNRLGTFVSVLFFLGSLVAHAQVANDCVNAIPICTNTPINGGTNGIGIDDFAGAASTGCLKKTAEGTIELNSAWYRFKTGASGQLGFNIGFDSSEDWDFALYRSDDCGNLGEPVRCNFRDNSQNPKAFTGVGQDPTGSLDNFQYEDWLGVETGEEYYLLINNFTNTNSGFSIQFTGQIFVTDPDTALDCSIVEELLGPPVSACEGDTYILDASTTGVDAYRWFFDSGSGFQEISGETGPELSVTNSGRYRVEFTTDASNMVTSEVQVGFAPIPTANFISNDASCSGLDVYDLSQKDAEALGTQDPNIFAVSYYLSLSDANSGTNVLPKQYETQPGSQTIFVRISSINNPDCFDVTERFELINLESPSLNFPSEAYICEDGSSVFIGEERTLPNHTYIWDSGETSAGITVSTPGEYTVKVINSTGGVSCERSKTITVVESKAPQLLDVEVNGLQANNTIKVIASADGEWEYRINDGPFQEDNTFYNVAPGANTVTVYDPKGCGEVTEEIIVAGFPKFFSPNLDGSNDYWQVQGIDKLQDPKVYIYNRYGQLLKFLGANDTQGWDGMLNGALAPATDYWFQLTYIDEDGQVKVAKYVSNHFALKH